MIIHVLPEVVYFYWPSPMSMMTSFHGYVFPVTGPLWGEPPVTGGFHSQMVSNGRLYVFFDVSWKKRLDKRLSVNDLRRHIGHCHVTIMPCTVFRYRTIDGSCNNLDHTLWGSSYRPLRRLMNPDYGDGGFRLQVDMWQNHDVIYYVRTFILRWPWGCHNFMWAQDYKTFMTSCFLNQWISVTKG